MANEISITSTLSLTRTAAPVARISKSLTGQVTQNGSDYSANTYAVTNSETNLPKGGITNIGWLLIKNLDATPTNFVQLGTVTGQLPIKVFGGQQVGPIRVCLNNGTNATNVIAITSAGTQTVEYLLIED
jgi:hypothetical protein